MSSEEVIYCICRSSDVSRFMIGCDHCEEWYHGDCINVTAQEAKYIKKFFCKECRKKNPKLEVVFKSKYSEKIKELNQTPKKERREDHSEKEKKSKEKKKNRDKERERERSKERHKHKEKKNKKDRDERKDEKKHKHKSKGEDNDREERKEKEEIKEKEKKEKKSKPVISDSDDDADKGNDKNKEKEKEKLEEAEKEKARRKEKELQKERQKLREEKRKEKEEEEAERKRKEAKEKEKKEKSQSTENKAKHEPEKTKSAPLSKELINLSQSSSEDDWKPAAVQPPPSLKRKPLKEQGSNKRKRAWRPDYGSSEDEEVHDLAPRQCYGMDCLNCARVGSKYCSDQCGLTVASLRIYQTLPERIREWNMTSCKAESKNGKELESIRQEILVAKQRLEELDRDAEKLETTISKGKSMTLIEHNAEDSSDEDEEVRGSGGAINCISCGKDIPARIAIRHMESCFNKIESQTSFGSMYKTKIEGYQMFCDFFNPQTGTYCKRLRVICPEHTKDLKMSDSEVCGYPLTKHVFQSSGEYCRLSRKACNEHYCWEKLKRAELDMDRVRQWLKLDELLEKERQEKEAMSRRAGVLNLLLHSTFNHEMAKILQKKNSRTNLPQAKPQKRV